MNVVLDIEANGLLNTVTKIHCIVCKDIDTNELYVFQGEELRERFRLFAPKITKIIGHNVIDYDLRVIKRLLNVDFPSHLIFDTLVVSRLLCTSREGGHSLENWGLILKHNKTEHHDFTTFSQEMLDYCINDVELNYKVYLYLKKILDRNGDAFTKAIDVEHEIQRVCCEMSDNGICLDIDSLERIDKELEGLLTELDAVIQRDFPPVVTHVQLKTKVKEIITPFNPASPKQIVDRLWECGWKPTEKTKTHIEHTKEKKVTERDKRYGWKVNENNLASLPETAPEGARSLVKYILLNARRRTLAEWRAAYDPTTGRIHGRFNPLGTSTQRCTHSNPNLGNIATKKTIKYNTKELRELAIKYGGELRSLWMAPKDGWLVGCDMESAHLRIFAHLIDDKDFTKALISGSKEDGTDPHSVNKRILGELCVDRDRAKTFIFSFLNGAGASKVSEIFSCSFKAAEEALATFIRAYPGLEELKRKIIPADARRGYFIGIDGRKVMCNSEHLMMGMYLQNMESVLMKHANVMWRKELDGLKINYKQINWVHDEWVTEVQGDIDIGRTCGIVQAASIKRIGEEFNLRCPMGGEYKVGKNWLEVH